MILLDHKLPQVPAKYLKYLEMDLETFVHCFFKSNFLPRRDFLGDYSQLDEIYQSHEIQQLCQTEFEALCYYKMDRQFNVQSPGPAIMLT